jgi:ribosome biogenesis protein Tsr3
MQDVRHLSAMNIQKMRKTPFIAAPNFFETGPTAPLQYISALAAALAGFSVPG